MLETYVAVMVVSQLARKPRYPVGVSCIISPSTTNSNLVTALHIPGTSLLTYAAAYSDILSWRVTSQRDSYPIPTERLTGARKRRERFCSRDVTIDDVEFAKICPLRATAMIRPSNFMSTSPGKWKS